MKKNQMLIVAIVLVIVIIAAAGGAWMLLNNKGGGKNNSDYTTFYTPQVGSYIKYKVTENTLNYTDWRNYSWKGTITSIQDPNEMVLVVWWNPQGNETLNTSVSIPCDQTFGVGCDINYPGGNDVTQVGIENLTTLWGERTCIHYHTIFSTGTEDFWVHNGILMKDIVVDNDLNMVSGVLVLTETNIPEVTHQ